MDRDRGQQAVMADTMDLIAQVGALAAAVIASFFGIVAARVKVRNDIDAFIQDIHRQSTWASWAAVFAALSAGLQAAAAFLPG